MLHVKKTVLMRPNQGIKIFRIIMFLSLKKANQMSRRKGGKRIDVINWRLGLVPGAYVYSLLHKL